MKQFDPISLQRWKIRQIKDVLPLAEPNERPEIKRMIRNNQIKLALLLKRADLESAIENKFDPIISRKLDAIEVLLEE